MLLKALQFILFKSGDEGHITNSSTLNEQFSGSQCTLKAARAFTWLPNVSVAPEGASGASTQLPPRPLTPSPWPHQAAFCFCGLTCSGHFLQMEPYNIELWCLANLTEHVVFEVHPHCITGPIGNRSVWHSKCSPALDSENQWRASQHTGTHGSEAHGSVPP